MVQGRPIFQGNDNSNKLSPKKKLNYDLAKSISERRRRSLMMSKNFAQSEQVKQLMDEAINDSMLKDGSAEERLHAIMTKAKEQGVTIEKTFLLFTQGKNKTIYITSHVFQQAILRLASQNALLITREEVEQLMKRFDLDGDGMISLLEFKYYCLTNIHSVAWKAERQRLDRTGEMERMRDRMNVVRRENADRYRKAYIEPIKEEDEKEGDEKLSSRTMITRSYWNLIRKSISSPALKKIKTEPIPCGDAVFNTTKLFWRQKVKLLIRMFYCEELDIITIQFTDDTDDIDNTIDESICLYVRKCDCPIKESDIEDATQAIKSSSFSGSSTLLLQSPRPFSNGFNSHTSNIGTRSSKEVDHLTVKKRVEWTLYGNYILARLRLEAISNDDISMTTASTTNRKRYQYRVILTHLTGDTYDTLSVNKPLNLCNPRKSLIRSSNKNNRISMVEFEKKAKAANDALKEIHKSCRNLKHIRSLLDDAMNDIDELSDRMELASTSSGQN